MRNKKIIKHITPQPLPIWKPQTILKTPTKLYNNGTNKEEQFSNNKIEHFLISVFNPISTHAPINTH